MGCKFEFIVCSDDQKFAEEQLQIAIGEMVMIERNLSEYIESSYTSAINRSAGKGSVAVPEELYSLVTRCIKISELTQGAFDITTGKLKKLYNFSRESINLPSPDLIQQALEVTGYRYIHTAKNNSLYLTKQDVGISFASIGKGYAADRVKKRWEENGVKSGVINASGDLCVIGVHPDGSPWKAGIPDPEKSGEMLLFIPVTHAIATSGDYEQYFEIEGRRYSHTINPVTGVPVSGIKSVSVTGRQAELCDALATAITVMGVEVGLHFVSQLPGIHCLIIDEDNRLHFTENITFEKNN